MDDFRDKTVALVVSTFYSDLSNKLVEGAINKFVEKPNMKQPVGGWVNSGIYLINPNVIDNLVKQYSGFAYDVIPQALNRNQKLYGYKIKNDLWAIDTPELFSNTINELDIS